MKVLLLQLHGGNHMNYQDFLTRIIDDGVEAATQDYADSPAKRRGSIAGFEACRGCPPAKLAQLLKDARAARDHARDETQADRGDLDDYWEARCYEAEVEWVCNCVSVILVNEGRPPIVPPTARGVMKASGVLSAQEGP